MNTETIKGKRRARKLALQALYQWLMTNSELYEIEAQFHASNDMTKVDSNYLHRLLHGVVNHLNEIENAFAPYLDRHIDSLNPIELTVLRLSGYELMFCPEIPYRVVLDEAVTLTKAFGSQEGHRYVNGVLNNLARDVRAKEIEHNDE
ncbi:transcription antitermination factor NusB [Legionella impletisoli]|uniref:transcription antitermination factor NusB n=1 Tax=Legionella impletisoli TaxID=343510 RepID=UPI0010419734|nr:transcription antitermination factor NusB [Legionella impletisoli]